METLNNHWLSISDYANEYQISISTLRRRIKSNLIPYKMIGGKYYIAHSPPVEDVSSLGLDSADLDNRDFVTNTRPAEVTRAAKSFSSDMFSQRELVEELKKAYMSSLHDKEEQIVTLKQQVSDLKTLVMFLEKEVSRLKTEF